MSGTATTPDAGTGALTVEGAANAFAGLMNDDGEFAPPPAPKKAKAKVEPVEEDEDPDSTDDDTTDPVDPDPEGDEDDDEVAQESEEADDADADEEAEDDDETSDEPDEEDLIPVKIDGKTEKLTLDELKKGYSRTAVFTKKTQEAAELRKQAEADRATVAQERAILAQALREVEERIKTLEPEPDWEALRAKDPAEWTYQRQVWAEKQEERQRLAEVAGEMHRRNTEDQQKQLAERLKAEQAALLEKVPAWKDPAKSKAELETIASYAKTLGFSDDDLNGVVDHRVLVLLRDASRYQTLLRRTAKLSADGKGQQKTTTADAGAKDSALDKIRPLTPRKSRGTIGRAEARQKAVAQVAKTGRIDDAAKAFEMLLPDI